MLVSLEGKVAIVTGASKGIGKAIAARLAGAGASVMLSSRKIEQLEAAAAEIGGDTAVFAANAGHADAAEACVAATIERFGRLDILLNNAATNPHYGPHARRRHVSVRQDVRGEPAWAVAVAREAHRQGFADHPGVIVNISSSRGLRAEPGIGVYNLTRRR